VLDVLVLACCHGGSGALYRALAGALAWMRWVRIDVDWILMRTALPTLLCGIIAVLDNAMDCLLHNLYTGTWRCTARCGTPRRTATG
jgi:hypothetical protein